MMIMSCLCLLDDVIIVSCFDILDENMDIDVIILQNLDVLLIP